MIASPLTPSPSWSRRDLLWGVAVAAALLLGSQLVLALLIRTTIITMGPLTSLVLLSTGEALLLLPLAILLRRGGIGWRGLGFRAIDLRRAVVLYGQAMLIGYGLTIAWGLVLMRFGQRAQENILPTLFGETPLALVAALVPVSIVAPLVEEAFFRGFLFTGLRQQWGSAVAMAGSAIVFAVVHLNPLAFPVLLGLGVILAWLFHRSGSLWPGIALHATINTVTLVIWYAQSASTSAS